MTVHGAQTSVYYHSNGRECADAATARARNTTIVIGVDQQRGVLLIDIDVQAEVCADVAELREQLLLIVDALNGHDPLADQHAPTTEVKP
jgi:hypothetical protein